MKAKILSLVAIIFISHVAMAQFHIGIKGGANISKLDGVSFKDQFKFGYHLGGFIEVGLGGNLGIQPEILFNQYSTTLDSNYTNIYRNVINPANAGNIKLNYLSIPVLLNYKPGSFFSLQAGPQFGILMDKNNTLLQDGSNAFKSGDFSLLGGAQLKISKIRISGRYVIGLNNINDIDNKDKWKNQAIQVSLGLAF